jgi:hypothetical protein
VKISAQQAENKQKWRSRRAALFFISIVQVNRGKNWHARDRYELLMITLPGPGASAGLGPAL